MRFDKLKLNDGSEHDVCAIVTACDREQCGVGIAKVPADYPLPPDVKSKLRTSEGFILVQTGRLEVEFAK